MKVSEGAVQKRLWWDCRWRLWLFGRLVGRHIVLGIKAVPGGTCIQSHKPVRSNASSHLFLGWEIFPGRFPLLFTVRLTSDLMFTVRLLISDGVRLRFLFSVWMFFSFLDSLPVLRSHQIQSHAFWRVQL